MLSSSMTTKRVKFYGGLTKNGGTSIHPDAIELLWVPSHLLAHLPLEHITDEVAMVHKCTVLEVSNNGRANWEANMSCCCQWSASSG